MIWDFFLFRDIFLFLQGKYRYFTVYLIIHHEVIPNMIFLWHQVFLYYIYLFYFQS
jgi:hypothetical protein